MSTNIIALHAKIEAFLIEMSGEMKYDDRKIKGSVARNKEATEILDALRRQPSE